MLKLLPATKQGCDWGTGLGRAARLAGYTECCEHRFLVLVSIFAILMVQISVCDVKYL